MKKILAALFLIFCSAAAGHAAALGTSFTYQGRLTDAGNPATGSYDLRFILYSAESGGSQVGNTLTNEDVSVTGGLFIAPLDFGAGIFDGTAHWLEVAVRPGADTGSFTALSPRQSLTPTPNALFSVNASLAAAATTATSAASATAVSANGVNTAAIQDGAVNSAKITDGTVAAADVNAATFNTTFWKTDGNAGTTSSIHFLGTADNQPVEFKVNGARAFRLEPHSETPNVVGGVSNNTVLAGIKGATIAGGGLALFPNTIRADFATIGGGTFHTAAGVWATIAGGRDNVARSEASTIAGGRANLVNTNATYGAVGGGFQNLIEVDAVSATVGGGSQNAIRQGASSSTIGGGGGNHVGTNSLGATVGGGSLNRIGNDSGTATIAGGFVNRIQASTLHGAIGGGVQNQIGTNAYASVIAGGDNNSIFDNVSRSFIGGGINNSIASFGTAPAFGAVIVGGRSNALSFSSSYSTIGGGQENSITAQWSVIPGGSSNTVSASYGLAAGRQAKVNHAGTFVWADAAGADFASSTNNEFAVRAGGGARFETGGAGLRVDGQPVLAGDGASIAEILDDDGIDSGLDADLLDGLDSTGFALAAHNHFGQSWSGSATRGLSITTTNTGAGVAAVLGRQSTGFGLSLGTPVGVWGDAADGWGVLGTGTGLAAILADNGAVTGVADGVRGISRSSSGAGVRGFAPATNGFTYGVYGDAASTNGTGVYGLHAATTGAAPGVEGETDSTSGSAVGVLGRVTSTSVGGLSAGVRGINNGTSTQGIGVHGSHAGSGWGVYGQSVSGIGVFGQSTSGVAVRAQSASTNIIEGWSSSADREFYVSNTGSVFADGPYSGAGADFAEMLPARDGLEPGDVLVIGEDGQLTRSSLPHQESVVGVHSSKPGFLGGAGDDIDLTGKVPLAVIGVVPVKVTNENGSIRPGNLLTSSSTAGHAMKAGANAPNGTVIGKALATFTGESGTIQMLVLLQ